MCPADHPNDPSLKSFIPVDAESHFPIQNLPVGIFSTAEQPRRRAGTAIGNQILDLSALEERGVFGTITQHTFSQPTLNGFLELGPKVWEPVRNIISQLLRDSHPELRDNPDFRRKVLVESAAATLHLPIRVGGFSDFLLSENHAKNCVDIVGGATAEQIWPNWYHFPMGYNSRASSVVVSGTEVIRPKGQIKPRDQTEPNYGVSQQLDFETEVAIVIGRPNRRGTPIPMTDAEAHIFGVVLLNDWSVRDIQAWEAQPLGVFNSKNLATSISPWIVPLAALEPFRIQGPQQDPTPLPYLRQNWPGGVDAQLEAWIRPAGAAEPTRVCRSFLRTTYWTFAQQVVHHTSSGCNIEAGDLLGSGTVSGSQPGELGCLFEASRNGTQHIELEQGGSRIYLEDGDEVILTGWCQGKGYRVGFGTCTGMVRPAISDCFLRETTSEGDL